MRALPILVQLALAVAVLTGYRVESASFRTALLALLVAYPVHVMLPARARLPFFAMLGVAALVFVAGPVSAAWILALGGSLIALAHLPIPFRARLGLIVMAAVALGVLRATPPTTLPRPWSEVVWPILASMFMFRFLVYLYDLSHKSAPFSFWRAVAYFFMVPNVWFPLFPIVDYQAFNRAAPEAGRFRNHQIGIDWVVRGAVQLILYRVVYQHLLVDPVTIAGLGDLVRALVTTFLLYLRISGSFHLIVGILRLFDFALPETHHLYFLASGFSDFWRRINIYWKDFVMKLVFYPAFFRLRKTNPAGAMVPATLLAFAATWALHSWQWFWMCGSFLVSLTDTLFWAILAVLVTIDAVRESKPGARATRARGWNADLRRALATIGTFSFLTVLWSFWTVGSWGEFTAMFGRVRSVSAADVGLVAAILAVIGTWSVIDNRTRRLPARAGTTSSGWLTRETWLSRDVMTNAAVALILVALAMRPVQARLPEPAGRFFAELESPRLNDQDLALLQRGYYEDLTQVHRFSPDLAIVYGERPPDYFIPWRQNLRDETTDYFQEVLKPNAAYTYMDVRYTTNRWGMRDRDYARERTPGVPRVALVGSSYTLGWGVADDETYESIAEKRLATAGTPVEILNFAVHAYDPVRNDLVLEQRVMPFHPDVAIVFCNTNERKTLVTNLAHAIEQGIPLPYPFLEEARAAAGVNRTTERAVMELRLADVADAAIEAAWTRFVTDCRAAGIVPIWIFMPETIARVPGQSTEQVPRFYEMARRAGFDVVTDLAPAFTGVDGETLKLFPWDYHPNVRGHELLAVEFENVLRREVLPRIGKSGVGGAAGGPSGR
ncbi:MAG TPA: SGNH/GDSL hydrolase family protein [Candidatus Eisenbacteria bacterium]